MIWMILLYCWMFLADLCPQTFGCFFLLCVGIFLKAQGSWEKLLGCSIYPQLQLNSLYPVKNGQKPQTNGSIIPQTLQGNPGSQNRDRSQRKDLSQSISAPRTASRSPSTSCVSCPSRWVPTSGPDLRSAWLGQLCQVVILRWIWPHRPRYPQWDAMSRRMHGRSRLNSSQVAAWNLYLQHFFVSILGYWNWGTSNGKGPMSFEMNELGGINLCWKVRTKCGYEYMEHLKGICSATSKDLTDDTLICNAQSHEVYLPQPAGFQHLNIVTRMPLQWFSLVLKRSSFTCCRGRLLFQDVLRTPPSSASTSG